jgi:hypothetical protein
MITQVRFCLVGQNQCQLTRNLRNPKVHESWLPLQAQVQITIGNSLYFNPSSTVIINGITTLEDVFIPHVGIYINCDDKFSAFLLIVFLYPR